MEKHRINNLPPKANFHHIYPQFNSLNFHDNPLVLLHPCPDQKRITPKPQNYLTNKKPSTDKIQGCP